MNDVDAATRPTEVVLETAAQLLVIRWADGHQSPLRYASLRRQCPCAECRELRLQASERPSATLRVLPTNAPQISTDLRDVHQVGAYALGLAWADGHDTGIYSFELLRALCECDACRAQHRA